MLFFLIGNLALDHNGNGGACKDGFALKKACATALDCLGLLWIFEGEVGQTGWPTRRERCLIVSITPR
jgi:hypothetical protein